MNPDDIWIRYFSLPELPHQEHKPRTPLREMLFPKCPVCGETCASLLA